MYRPTQITFSLPLQPLSSAYNSNKKPPSLICKLQFLHFLLEALRLNQAYKLLFRIGVVRLSMFILHCMLLWMSFVYLAASCVLHLLCCCTTHPSSTVKRSIPSKWEKAQSPKTHSAFLRSLREKDSLKNRFFSIEHYFF